MHTEHSKRDTTQVTSQEINLFISSDIIESLFGKFKYFMERSSHSGMNQSVLLVPAFCGELNAQKIIQALESVQHVDLKTWEAENIPPSIYKNRKNLISSNFAPCIIQNTGKNGFAARIAISTPWHCLGIFSYHLCFSWLCFFIKSRKTYCKFKWMRLTKSETN